MDLLFSSTSTGTNVLLNFSIGGIRWDAAFAFETSCVSTLPSRVRLKSANEQSMRRACSVSRQEILRAKTPDNARRTRDGVYA